MRIYELETKAEKGRKMELGIVSQNKSSHGRNTKRKSLLKTWPSFGDNKQTNTLVLNGHYSHISRRNDSLRLVTCQSHLRCERKEIAWTRLLPMAHSPERELRVVQFGKSIHRKTHKIVDAAQGGRLLDQLHPNRVVITLP